MALKIRNGETILFIGDSITDCGRRDVAKPLGNGYVKLFADLALMREPAKEIRIINKGIGGDRVTGLRQRWTDDVLWHRPDWLSVKIGINDLHSALGGDPNGVSPRVYEDCYDEILARTRKALPRCRVLLIDPFYISAETAKTSIRREVLDRIPSYTRIVHAMSQRYKTRLVKTHDIFQKLLRHCDADTFCPEPVHPHLTGHLVIAESVYNALSA
jgi:lysophospholipase L1-like esterase